MKKNIALIVSFFTASIQGMETNFWTVACSDTKINVNKKSMFDTYAENRHNIDLIVWGHYQQNYVHGLLEQQEKSVGTCDTIRYPVVKLKNSSLLIEFRHRENNPIFLRVVEPYLHFSVDDDEIDIDPEELENYFEYPCYETTRLYNSCIESFEFGRDQAIQEACKDLDLCYKNVLWQGYLSLCGKIRNSIALPTLGTRYENSQFAFPRKEAAPIAVKSIVEFLKNNPEICDRIELFVDSYLEFILYKLLLMKHCGLTEKICLLSCAQKDSEHFVSTLPYEIMDYIMKLYFINA